MDTLDEERCEQQEMIDLRLKMNWREMDAKRNELHVEGRDDDDDAGSKRRVEMIQMLRPGRGGKEGGMKQWMMAK